MEKTNYHAFILPCLLMFAGILSPSNGIDDAVEKEPYDLFATASILLLASVFLYLFWISLIQVTQLIKSNNEA